MKKGKLLKRGLASLLAAVLAVGLLPMMPGNMATVKAADGDKTIAGLGTGVIADPTAPTETTNAWQGSYVYFGTYNGSPVKYRVLDSETSVFGGTTMLLDCDSILWAGTNNDGQSSAFDADSNVWADSDIRSYLNATFLTSNFSTAEQNAIASSTKNATDNSDGVGLSYLNYAELNNDKIFFLDAKEATNTNYGYSNTDDTAANRVKTGGSAYWWLRSASADYTFFAGIVDSDGYIYDADVFPDYVGVSPALNINLSSVLFSSVISGTAGTTGAEYKLTILDDKMTIAGNGDVTRNGDTVTIPYTISGTNSGNATQVSVLILDKAYTAGNTNGASVLAYEKLAVDSFSVTGTGTFTLPSDLSDKVCGTDYYAYIIAEDVNGEKETDYASTPISITVPASIVNHTITATAGENGSLSIRGSGAFSKFVGVKVDGTHVDAKNYTVKEGSTIVTLKADYLNTLSVGTHTFEILWTDGSASTTFTIKADFSDDGNNNRKDDVPKTGDDTSVAWLFILFILSGTGLIITVKKRRVNLDSWKR